MRVLGLKVMCINGRVAMFKKWKGPVRRGRGKWALEEKHKSQRRLRNVLLFQKVLLFNLYSLSLSSLPPPSFGVSGGNGHGKVEFEKCKNKRVSVLSWAVEEDNIWWIILAPLMKGFKNNKYLFFLKGGGKLSDKTLHGFKSLNAFKGME